MKHTFEGGIIGESYDCAGDEFLRGMIHGHEKPKSLTDFGQIDDHGVLRVDEFAMTPDFDRLLSNFTARAVTRGYTVDTWTDHARNFAFCVRLRKEAQ